MAGESAEETARRAREKAERLLRHAEAYEKGAAGERAVQEVLATLSPEWTVFHDLHWPGRAKANVDHLVIGPSGAFIIDTKNWSGSITATKGVLRQNGYSRATAVDGVREAARAVAALAPSVSPKVFTPVLCFVGGNGVDADLGGVLLCRVESLLALLMGRPVALSEESLDFLRFELDMSTRAATGPVAPKLAMPRTSSSVASASTPHHRRAERRIPRALRRLVVGVGLWWLACFIVTLTVGLTTHNGALVGCLDIALALLSTVAVRRIIRE